MEVRYHRATSHPTIPTTTTGVEVSILRGSPSYGGTLRTPEFRDGRIIDELKQAFSHSGADPDAILAAMFIFAASSSAAFFFAFPLRQAQYSYQFHVFVFLICMAVLFIVCCYSSDTGWMGGWMDGWLLGRMDGWMDEWMDRRMDTVQCSTKMNCAVRGSKHALPYRW